VKIQDGSVWNVTAGDRAMGIADAEDERGDSVDERYERRRRPRADLRERDDNVVHHDVDGDAIEREPKRKGWRESGRRRLTEM
jgi:hypothetical protein